MGKGAAPLLRLHGEATDVSSFSDLAEEVVVWCKTSAGMEHCLRHEANEEEEEEIAEGEVPLVFIEAVSSRSSVFPR